MSHTLRDFSGTLVLVGAGKMGGAMLEGWLALGLDPREGRDPGAAARARDRGARGARRAHQSGVGRRCERDRHRGQAAGRRRRGADARSRSSARAPSRSRSWPARRSAFSKARSGDCAIVRSIPNTPAAIGRGITVAVPNAQGDARRSARSPHTLLGARRRGRMGRRRRPDRCRRPPCPARARPMCSCSPKASRAPAPPPACRPTSRRGSRARPSRARANCCTSRRSMPRRLRQNVTSPGGTTAAALAC